MLNLLIDLVLLGIVAAVLYAIYLIPPVKRYVRGVAKRHSNFLIIAGFALFVAAVMWYVVLPRI